VNDQTKAATRDRGDEATTARMSLPLTEITQTWTTKQDEDGNIGDCKRAAVASIFGMQAEDVPHFAVYGYGMEEPTRWGWWYAFIGWCQTLEPAYDIIEVEGNDYPPPSLNIEDLYGCYLISGKSPRGDWNHSVVGRGGEVIWDPHPSREGIRGEPESLILFIQRGWDPSEREADRG
jgi:hypothetical protein